MYPRQLGLRLARCVYAVAACFSPGAMAQIAGEWTHCIARQGGSQWNIVNGQVSAERCHALAKQCLNNPAAESTYYGNPVIINAPYIRCTQTLKVPSSQTAAPSQPWLKEPGKGRFRSQRREGEIPAVEDLPRHEWAQGDNGKDVGLSDAISYCSSLGAGWGLPTVNELMSLFNGDEPTRSCGKYLCKVSTSIPLSSARFWSADSLDSPMRVGLPNRPLTVFLDDGTVGPVGRNYTDGMRALCVIHPIPEPTKPSLRPPAHPLANRRSAVPTEPPSGERANRVPAPADHPFRK